MARWSEQTSERDFAIEPWSRRSCAGRRPVIHFRRTCTQERRRGSCRTGFKQGRQGGPLVRIREPRRGLFDDPYRFGHRPHPPTTPRAYGGPGPPTSVLARPPRPGARSAVMFRELCRRMPDIRAVDEAGAAAVELINGIKHLPAGVEPPRPLADLALLSCARCRPSDVVAVGALRGWVPPRSCSNGGGGGLEAGESEVVGDAGEGHRLGVQAVRVRGQHPHGGPGRLRPASRRRWVPQPCLGQLRLLFFTTRPFPDEHVVHDLEHGAGVARLCSPPSPRRTAMVLPRPSLVPAYKVIATALRRSRAR